MRHCFYPRITVDQDICLGKPCIRGTRMPVASLLEYLSAGKGFDEVRREFPFLERDDITQALAYSAAMMEERFVALESAD